jgi:hypothetical protein
MTELSIVVGGWGHWGGDVGEGYMGGGCGGRLVRGRQSWGYSSPQHGRRLLRQRDSGLTPWYLG